MTDLELVHRAFEDLQERMKTQSLSDFRNDWKREWGRKSRAIEGILATALELYDSGSSLDLPTVPCDPLPPHESSTEASPEKRHPNGFWTSVLTGGSALAAFLSWYFGAHLLTGCILITFAAILIQLATEKYIQHLISRSMIFSGLAVVFLTAADFQWDIAGRIDGEIESTAPEQRADGEASGEASAGKGDHPASIHIASIIAGVMIIGLGMKQHREEKNG